MITQIHKESCLKTMAKMDNDFIDLTVTSPPYDNLRSYKNSIDKKWGEYLWRAIIEELYRVTKPGGVVVWVVGDATIDGSETGSSFKQALHAIQCGFKLHDTMIYQKNNFSNPSSNRYHQIFEYMFVFSKGKPKTFNSIKDRKNKYAGQVGSWGKNTVRQKDGSMKENSKKIIKEFGQRYNVWQYKTSKNGQEDEIAYKHPAIFPIGLVRDHIKSWSNEGDLVYDPFMGSGTTACAAIDLKRNWIGSELSQTYITLSNKRIKLHNQQVLDL